MRKTNRIPTILKSLEALWRKNPDQRLGQLICNLTRPQPNPDFDLSSKHRMTEMEEEIARHHYRWHMRTWNVEDEDLLESIEEGR